MIVFDFFDMYFCYVGFVLVYDVEEIIRVCRFVGVFEYFFLVDEFLFVYGVWVLVILCVVKFSKVY